MTPPFAYYYQAPAPAFDVASVKIGPVIKGDLYNINLGRARNGMVTLGNTTLKDCLRFAYGYTTDAQISGPDWIGSKEFRFEITAKTAPETPYEKLLLMLRTLLAERFQLKTHREQKEMTHYELVVGKNGPKFHESTVDADSVRGINRGDGITTNRMPMHQLAVLMSRMTRTPVLDMTGLTGFYEFKLEWAPENSPESATGPSIFTAVQEQLGLKLESRKGPVEVLVVDHAEKIPLEN